MVAIGADNKRNLYILGGLFGALLLVGFFTFMNPFGRRSTTTTAATNTAANAASNTVTTVQTTSATGVTGAGATGAGAAGAASPGASGTPLPRPLTVVNPRRDPFAPKYLPALPTPVPPPPPPPPVQLPDPVAVPQPAGFSPGGAMLPSPGAPSASEPLNLPPTNIPQYSLRGGPRNVAAPGVVADATGGAQPAPEKRIAGVAIGDSVRALIEINDGTQTITRVVQPGDEVEGMRILRVERVNEGGQQTTRMWVREAGQDRYFDLRPSSNPVGAGGPGGFPGGPPGGFPGAPFGGRP
jgi:hypothetical protein